MSVPRADDGTDQGAWPFLALDDAALLGQSEMDTYRASGPGGQKRNKTDSAVRLRHRPTGLSAIGTESRSQHENKARALRRLRKTLALSLRRPIGLSTYAPSSVLSSCMTKGNRLEVGQKDARYLPVIAELLDLITSCELQVSTAAARVGVSTANLVAFFQKDPALWSEVNRRRSGAGLKPLR